MAAKRKLRELNPESREGVSADSLKLAGNSINKFKAWLEATGRNKLTAGRLMPTILSEFMSFLAMEDVSKGNGTKTRSSATLNKYRRYLVSCINFLATLRPKLFPDPEHLLGSLKQVKEQKGTPVVFKPAELVSMLDAALERETPNRRVVANGRKRKYEQKKLAGSASMVSRVFLLIALTGCRNSETMNLTWDRVDLERGRITFVSQKTGGTRILPLTGDMPPLICTTQPNIWKNPSDSTDILPSICESRSTESANTILALLCSSPSAQQVVWGDRLAHHARRSD